VVAVVNKHVILASDLDDEIRLSVLDPNRHPRATLTRQQALEQLISRALIEQQIRQEDMQAIEPSQDEVDARLHEIRTELPACVRKNCASDAGWKAFLAAHGLTPERVEAYLRYRLEILRFIEQRFRQGIKSRRSRSKPTTTTPCCRSTPGETVPPLDQVAPRIQEILLQQQVNVLFDNWLTNLRQQGDVEVLDPILLESATCAPQPAPARKLRCEPGAARKGGADERSTPEICRQEPSARAPRRGMRSRLRRFFLRHLPLAVAARLFSGPFGRRPLFRRQLRRI
jgi:peptidyl-prolyl cis-trans isomerase SurA